MLEPSQDLDRLAAEGEFSYQEQRMLSYLCRTNQLAFTRYFFRKRENSRFIVSPHHSIMAHTLDRVVLGEIPRLIINVPPGYTKTEMAVINFCARGFAINPASRFIHASYADSLALVNSRAVREVVTSEEFQALWPMQLRQDSQSKKNWANEFGGSMLSVASGGTITGFRAGRMMERFSGALIIDDPLKPDDAFSDTIREKINMRFTNTFKSRLAHEQVPIIVIMQRLHEDDPTGFLLRGGTGEKWHHLILQVDIPEGGLEYPSDYTHGIEIKHGLPPGPLWPYKHNAEQIQIMRESDSYTYASQYDQRPAPLGGGIFKTDWWKFYEVAPNVEYRFITADTAQKEAEHNDFSVFQCWGVYEGRLYLLDQLRGKWEAPSLRQQFIAFWNKHWIGLNPTRGQLRAAYVEDKASGTGLIQDIRRDQGGAIPIIPVPRTKDKVTRAMDCVSYIESGYVYLPAEADFLSEYMAEFAKFTPLMTHRYDDQIDATLDAIEKGLRPPTSRAGTW